MEPESSLPHSQASAICLYPEPAQSSPHAHILVLKIHLNIILPSTPGFPQWYLPLRFSTQNPVHASPIPIRATCPTHLILFDFITCTISRYKNTTGFMITDSNIYCLYVTLD
jgi:hypothetical protein